MNNWKIWTLWNPKKKYSEYNLDIDKSKSAAPGIREARQGQDCFYWWLWKSSTYHRSTVIPVSLSSPSFSTLPELGHLFLSSYLRLLLPSVLWCGLSSWTCIYVLPTYIHHLKPRTNSQFRLISWQGAHVVCDETTDRNKEYWIIEEECEGLEMS